MSTLLWAPVVALHRDPSWTFWTRRSYLSCVVAPRCVRPLWVFGAGDIAKTFHDGPSCRLFHGALAAWHFVVAPRRRTRAGETAVVPSRTPPSWPIFVSPSWVFSRARGCHNHQLPLLVLAPRGCLGADEVAVALAGCSHVVVFETYRSGRADARHGAQHLRQKEQLFIIPRPIFSQRQKKSQPSVNSYISSYVKSLNISARGST